MKRDRVAQALIVVLLFGSIVSITLNKSGQQSSSGFSVAKDVEAQKLCEPGTVKGIESVSILGVQGSRYLLCSESGVWTGPHESTKPVEQIRKEHKIA